LGPGVAAVPPEIVVDAELGGDLPFALSVSFAGSQFGGEVFDGCAVLEVPVYYLRYVVLRNAEVPGTARVDHEVRAVLAEAEAVCGVDAHVPVQALRAQLVLESLADGFGSALLAVAALADEHVGVVVPDLRGRLCERRQRADFRRPFLLRLLTLLRDRFLRF
jgi:hypothetical protein